MCLCHRWGWPFLSYARGIEQDPCLRIVFYVSWSYRALETVHYNGNLFTEVSISKHQHWKCWHLNNSITLHKLSYLAQIGCCHVFQLWIWEQAAIISLYYVNWLVSISETGRFYVVHTVHVLTVNILVSSNIYTRWYTIYDLCQLLTVSSQRCHPQEVIVKKFCKPTCQSRFCSLFMVTMFMYFSILRY